MQVTALLAVSHSELAEKQWRVEEEKANEQEEEEGGERKREKEEKRRRRKKFIWRNGHRQKKTFKIISLCYICTCMNKADAGN